MAAIGTISSRPRSRLPRVVAGLALLAAILLVVSALRVAAPTSVGWATAMEACQAPASAEKGGQTLKFDWQVAVEEDRPDVTALLFVSGADEMLCLASRGTENRYSGASSGMGRMTPTKQATLTYDMSVSTGPSDPPVQLVAGRMPPTTTSVLVTAADGATQQASIGNGHYIGWLATDAMPVRIAALDSGGNEISALVDQDGLKVAQ